MAYLTPAEVIALSQAINKGSDYISNRGSFYQSVEHIVMGQLPIAANTAIAKLLAEIGFLNKLERIPSGQVPLLIFLQNASVLVIGTDSEKTVKELLDKVERKVSGAPALDITTMPEVKEVIIHHTDDTVTFAFMEAALKAAPSIYKLRIPAFENGQPRLNNKGEQLHGLGTGWLLTDSLIMTNHHVINAREEGEPDATRQDFLLQGQAAMAIADFDREGATENDPIQALQLEANDPALDYAILRIPPTGRKPLRRKSILLQLNGDPIPVNIIQHPGGRSKRYGIRNNLVWSSTPEELRYFTDTQGGSSGSPVFNDQWEVVALHRAARYVDNVQFQGKTTAYVNVGTHLKLIMDDIGQRYPALAAEIVQG